MAPLAWTAILWTAVAQDENRENSEVHERTRPSVVAVRAMAVGGERSGTGVFLDKEGVVLTSYWTVPHGASDVRVWTHEPRRYAAEIVAQSKRDEIALLRIRPRTEPAPIRFGSSSRAKIGDAVYTLGNAENSDINDHSPAFNFGLLSGRYTLRKARSTGYYVGQVLETSAAVNLHMEGAPLLDAGGRMIGMITLNFSPQRWLGNAIPSDFLQARIAALRGGRPGAGGKDAAEDSAGHLGLQVREEGDRLVVAEADASGPAYAAGIRKGDAVTQFRGKPVKTVAEFTEALRGLKAGDVVMITIDMDGMAHSLMVELAEPPPARGEE